MNFLQLVQRLHSESIRSTAAPTTVATTDARQARLVNWIKDAWRELQSEIQRDWKWMRQTYQGTLVAGQQAYAPIADFSLTRFGRWREDDDKYSPHTYYGTNGSALYMRQRSLDDFRSNFVYRPMGNSTPVVWTFDETQQLLVGPAPSLAYGIRIDYVREPYELGTMNADANLDEPDMPSRHHMLLVWRALIEVAKADAAPEMLARAEAGFRDMHFRLVLDQSRMPHL